MMKSLIGISAALLFVALAFASGPETTSRIVRPTGAPSASAELCPYQTPEEWQEFLNHYASDEKWVETCEDSACDADYYRFVRENVQSTFERCAKFIDQHDTIARCTKNLRRFTPIWLRQHDDDSYGFASTNHAYLADEESADKPAGMMKVPDAILAALPDRHRVEQAARDAGYKYLTHDSALDGYRTFVLISDPAGRYDEWMLLNIKNGEATVKAKTPLSVLTVLKKDARGNPLPKVRLYFRDYTLTPSKRGLRLALEESTNGKCYSCHSNGVRQLIPWHTPILEAEPVRGEAVAEPRDFPYQRLMEFNRRLRSYGAPDWNGQVTPADNGPVLGAAQHCTDCHDGNSRSGLTVFTSPTQIEKKMYTELSMPPDTGLARLLERRGMNPDAFPTAADRTLREGFGMHAALVKNFESSRLPALKKWFLEVSCQ